MKNKKKTCLVVVGLVYSLLLFSQVKTELVGDKILVTRELNQLATSQDFSTDVSGKDAYLPFIYEGDSGTSSKSENVQRKIHPYQHYFDTRKQSYTPNTRSLNFNKLLAVMVEFQEDDNEMTTGNGKFIVDSDHDYPITLGSPPYDRQFFETQLEAMKYYYRAVSFESFQLEYEVYPKTKQAYVLPREMGYYHPLEPHLFIERIEEYFQDVFTMISQDEDSPEFFGDFEHFMIIHAGSSWQHDVFGDTPQDMPSFFINIADGKEVIVDDGQTKIKSAANVPERIWQDIRQRGEYVFGYGVVNSVFAHEFGHSLGFVDLYNTVNGRPSVGLFDIMDSGGSESILFPGTPYVIEGLFPSLPSIWSRLNAFEDDFLKRKILVDLSDIPTGVQLQVLAASTKRETIEGEIPYFYRVRLSEDEYVLIENRTIDPDGDGGTAIQGALNGRVALHPSPYYSEGFSYEYDFLLPCFFQNQGEYTDVLGGGILIWHIDDNIIHKQGEIIDGVFYSNYERNRVNASGRGVRLIEADGLDDLGNPYSRFWRGTPYEYFYKYKPILDSEGYLVNWSSEIHNSELSASTMPALKTNLGRPSSWKISDISMADRVMTFKVSNSMFENTSKIGTFTDLSAISNMADLTDEFSGNISIMNKDGLQIFLPDESQHSWQHLFTQSAFAKKPDFGIQTLNFGLGDLQGYILVYESKILIIDRDNVFEKEFDTQILEPPINFFLKGESYLGIVFENSSAVYRINRQRGSTQLDLEQVIYQNSRSKFIPSSQTLYVMTDDVIFENCPCHDEHDEIYTAIKLPENFTKFEPVTYVQESKFTIYLMSDSFKLYSIINGKISQIFDLSKFTNESPSQLALGDTFEAASNFILLHTETWVFVLTEDGSFYPKFPQRIYDTKLKIDTHPFVFDIANEVFFLFTDTSQGFLGMGLNGLSLPHKSQYWNRGDVDPQFFINRHNKTLYMVYSDIDNNVFSATMSISDKDKILWNGFRNGSIGSLIRDWASEIIPVIVPAEIYIYPNPVRQNTANLRINRTSLPADIKIYNISGQLVLSHKTEHSIEDFRDFRFSTENFSSGVYFVFVEINGKTFRDKFTIVK